MTIRDARTTFSRHARLSRAALLATALVAVTMPRARSAEAAAPATCRVLVQTTSRNDEMLDRIREQARKKLTATGRYVLVTEPRLADATIETNSVPIKGRLGGTAMSAMLLAGQRSQLNTQVLLGSFLAIYSTDQEESAADAIVGMIDKVAAEQGNDLCPTTP